MKKQVCRITLTIILTALAFATVGYNNATGEEAVTLKYNFKAGDLFTNQMKMRFRASMPGMPGEMQIEIESLTTQVVAEVSKEGVYSLLTAVCPQVIQVSFGGRDMSGEIGGQVAPFEVEQQKMRPDGSIIEPSDLAKFDETPLSLVTPFASTGGFPTTPVKKGESWKQEVKIPSGGSLDVQWTLLGFQKIKDYDCAQLEGVFTGSIPSPEGVSITVEQGKLTNFFAVKEGFSLSQKGEVKMKLTPPPGMGGEGPLAINFELELMKKEELPPTQLQETIAVLELIASGLAELKKRNYDVAKAQFEEVLKNYPETIWRKDVEALMTKAIQPLYERLSRLREQGDLEKLLEVAQETLKSGNPSEKQMARYELINGFSNSGRLSEILPIFEKAIQENPNDVEAYKLLGQIYERNQPPNPRAVEMYERAAEINPNDGEAYSELGRLYQMQGLHDKAISAFKKAIELVPFSTDLYPQLAQAYVSAGKPEEALKLAEELKERAENNAYIYVQLGDVYSVAQKQDEAIEAYKKAVELRPEERYFKERLAQAYEKAGKQVLAEQLRQEIPEAERGFVRKAAPDFELKDLQGQSVKLSDFKGKVVILNLWATWAPLCFKEIPALEQLYKQYKEQGLVVIGISVDRNEDTVKSFVQKLKVTYPIVMSTEELLSNYRTTGEDLKTIPTTFIINKAGSIFKTHVSAQSKDVFEKDVLQLLR
ncbi:redoxin domain-containing protein [Candidatus Poribacteria bacterium]|nr:redoxin domain-containing protein [Candidatus Poribacteria bacterium]